MEIENNTMKRRIFSLLILLCLSVGNRAANPIDSLLESFDKRPTAQTANKFFDILHKGGLLDKPLRLTDSMSSDSLRQQVWYWAGEYGYAIQDYDLAVNYARRALRLIPKGSDTEADCLNLLSICHIRKGDYEQAAHYAKQCYKLDKESGDADRISSSLNTLAAIYMGANRPDEAEDYVLRGIEEARKADNPGRMAILQAMASEVYHAKGDDQRALPYIDEAIRLDSLNGMEERARMRLAQRASVLIGLHRYGDAEQTLRDAIAFLRKGDDRQSLGIALNKMGMALHCLERDEEAMPCYQEAADIFTELGDLYNEVHARRGLYETQWKSHPERARKEMERFNELKDSIYSITSAESLARYNAEFGNEWLELENHSQRRILKWGMGLAGLLGILAVVALAYIYRSRRRNRQLSEKLSSVVAELRAERMARNKEDKASEEGADDFLAQLTDVVNQEMDKGRADVNRVAAALGMSPFKLRQQMSLYTDEQPKDMIRRLRIERAAYLLRTRPELTVQETGFLCGYGDAANFTRAFKQATGLTPSEFQIKLKNLE